jgi:cholesterol transport system auxiliary component
MRRRAALLGGLALAGCGLSERPYTERRQWPLIVQRDPVLPPRPRGRVLQVRSLRAGPALSARGLQTLHTDGSIEIAYYEEWSVAPAEAVEEALRRWLAASGLFAAVIGAGSRLTPDYVLEGTLDALWADERERAAVATLGLALLDQRRDPVRVAAQFNATGRAPLAGTDAPALAAALRSALADAFAQAERAIGAAIG